ncbi:MAG: T9SS type A sorting domain-containing protein [Bacteroidia bacterium]|nr:T9SS type A sorting domain-containing protein [Bacteroidia bacterium]
MKKTFTLLCLLLLVQVASAQFTATSVTLKDDLIGSTAASKHGKAAGNKVDCSGDTLEYARFKASSLTALNVSAGYRVGQFFEAPGDVTISGFDFYAWVNSGQAKTKLDLYCHIFEAGADSLPSGTPVRTDTVTVDTTFGTGSLSGLQQRAVFSTPYKTNKPFIVVITSNDTNRTSVGINSFMDKDGLGENVACGTVGGRWYRCLDLNISGNILDCDILLEPHVSYEVNNDFTFKDCYDYNDTVKFTNTSSPFYFSKMYNRYSFFGYDRFCHRWDKGVGFFTVNEVQGETKFNSPANRTVRMISTLYHFRGGGTCIDTTIKPISYQPRDVDFQGDDNICSGNKSNLLALSDGETFWYRSPTDTSFHRGPEYESSNALEANDTLYANAINNQCESAIKRKVVEVITTPKLPTVKNDSICLNSYANLIATSNAGQVRWYKDSTTLIAVHSGDVLQVGPLKQDTFFFAKAINGACTHPGRIKVRALVSSAFAPKEPVVSNDTTICLLHGDITLKATGTNTLRWFDVAAGGTMLQSGNSFKFTPPSKGEHFMYVDAHDGNCASSRLPIRIDVNHFPEIKNLTDQEACAGEVIFFDEQNLEGDINWFSAATGGSQVYSGKFRIFDNVLNNETFYLEPYQGVCKDTVRHKWSYEAIPFGKIQTQTLDTQACDGTVPNLNINVDVGDVIWYDSTGENVLFTGENFVTAPFTMNRSYWYEIDNRGCSFGKKEHKIVWRVMPDANFNYEVKWRDVTFASILINQGDYIWHFDDGSDTSMGTDVTHHYFEDKTYNVSLEVRSPFGCNDTVTKQITINSLDIPELEKGLVQVYPNPGYGVLTIEGTNGFTPSKIQLLDLQGKIVYTRHFAITSSRIELDLTSEVIAPGSYLLRCSNGQTTATGRITLLSH